MTSKSLTLVGITKRFGNVRAMDNFNLEVGIGELVALLGPSGCGKTTALRVVAGLEHQDSGKVLVGEKDISNIPAHKRNMGMVFQAYSLFPNLTVEENVGFGLQMRKVSKPVRLKKAHQLLDLVGLDSQSKRFTHQLSGGQQQRVALARALAISPQVLLLDEPLSALDAKVRTQLRDEIRRIQLELGTTTLFVTHDQEEALGIADRVGVMRNGLLEQIAAPAELYDRPATSFVAEFVGLTNQVKVKVSGGEFNAFGSNLKALPGSISSGDGIALIRPESLTVKSSKTGEGKVISTSFLGSICRVMVALADGSRITAQMDSHEAANLHSGDSVDVSVDKVPVFVK